MKKKWFTVGKTIFIILLIILIILIRMLDPEDVEDYLEKYDTNWDKYSISIRKCTLFVKDLDRGNELQDREDYERLVKWYDWDIL